MRVGVSYTSVSPLPDPLRAIGGLFSAALSVASRRLAVSQRPVLWSSDFPLGLRVPAIVFPHPGANDRSRTCPALRLHVLSMACLPDPPRWREGRIWSPLPEGVSCRVRRPRARCHRRESNPHTLRHQHLKLACLPFHHDDVSATGGIRTHTPFRARRSQRRASTSSATVAFSRPTSRGTPCSMP